MLLKRIVFSFALSFFLFTNLFSEEVKLKSEEIKNPNFDYWKNQENDSARYLYTVGGIALGTMAVGAVILSFLPTSITNWDTGGEKPHLAKRWVNNVKEGPVWDKDDWTMNYVAHPYWGAVYYMQGRNAGYGPLGSFLVAFTASTFMWEYGVEAFAEVPSIQDIFVTPIIGSLVGEGFYYASTKIKANDEEVFNSKVLGITLLTIMDPAFLVMEKTGLKDYVKKQNANQTKQSYSSWGFQNNTIMLRTTIYIN
jgi:hypothetical protein